MDNRRITLINNIGVIRVTENTRVTDSELREMAERNNRIPGVYAKSFKRDPYVWMPYHFSKDGTPLSSSRFYNPLTKEITYEN